jgi:hypothetical protein
MMGEFLFLCLPGVSPHTKLQSEANKQYVERGDYTLGDTMVMLVADPERIFRYLPVVSTVGAIYLFRHGWFSPLLVYFTRNNHVKI